MKSVITKVREYLNKQELLSVFLLSLGSRIFIILCGIFLLTGSLQVNPVNLKDAFIHWDGDWYLDIVENGYDSSYSPFEPSAPECNTGMNLCQRNFAFFPLFPLLIKGTSVILNLDAGVTGVFLANMFFVFSTVLLYKLIVQIKGARLAKYSLFVFLTFPTTYIFSGVMTESLFLFLLLWAIYLAWNKKWLGACLVAALLSATRNTGILIIIPFFLIIVEQNKIKTWSQIVKAFKQPGMLSLLIAPLGLVAFMIYLNHLTGDPLSFINIQRYWEKPVNGVSALLAIPYSIINWSLESSLKIHIYNLLYFISALGLLVYGYLKKVLPLSLLSIILWLFVPLFSGSMLALPRYSSVLFPIFILIASLVVKYKWLGRVYLLLSFIASIILLRAYVQGLWITV